ncbi:glycosyltransferase family 2 protein [Psychrobacter faecalis]
MYKLSIIVPIYKTEPYVEECLKSILDQIVPEIQIICINDGTPDGAMDIARLLLSSYSSDIQKQFILVDQENKGLSGARNAGIEIATGDYIGFLDSDDKILPSYFSQLLPIIKSSDYDIIDFNLIDSNGNLLFTRKYTEKDSNDINSVFRAGNWFCCCRAFKRITIDKNRFINNIYYEDLGFTPSIYMKSVNIIHLDFPLYWYRMNQEGITLTVSEEGNQKTVESFEIILDLYINKYKATNNVFFKIVAIQTYFLLCANACRRLNTKSSLSLLKKYKNNSNILTKEDKELYIDILSSRVWFFYKNPKLYIILYSLYCTLRYN